MKEEKTSTTSTSNKTSEQNAKGVENEEKIVNFNTTDIPDKLNTASALNAVLSNVVMAHTSIETAVPYVKNSEFVDNLKQQIARYKDYEIQARDLADKVGV
ncbi:MAG: hypothetical protein RRY18_05550, partial [Clostridia bacterium]